MARFLLAWELGANLGHATRLRPVAVALKARGHQVSFALRDLMGSRPYLGPELGRAFQAPLALSTHHQPALTMADVLLSCGYDTAHGLHALAEAWKNLLELSACDALVADHSPTALLAARLAGIPALHIGHGFSVPPRQSPLPVFRDWASVPALHAEQSDARALAHANDVLVSHGKRPMQQLCELFYPEQSLLCTWPELDHYAGRGRVAGDYRGPDCEVAPGAAPSWPEGDGPRVFAYLRASHPHHAAVLQALDAAGCRVVCFMPDKLASAQALPVSSRIVYSHRPLDMRLVLADCALVVCHAGQATVAQAMLRGVPCLMLPLHAEQFLLAREFERHGAGVNVAARAQPLDYRALLNELIAPGAPCRQAARKLARAYGQFEPGLLTCEIAYAAQALVRAAGA